MFNRWSARGWWYVCLRMSLTITCTTNRQHRGGQPQPKIIVNHWTLIGMHQAFSRRTSILYTKDRARTMVCEWVIARRDLIFLLRSLWEWDQEPSVLWLNYVNAHILMIALTSFVFQVPIEYIWRTSSFIASHCCNWRTLMLYKTAFHRLWLQVQVAESLGRFNRHYTRNHQQRSSAIAMLVTWVDFHWEIQCGWIQRERFPGRIGLWQPFPSVHGVTRFYVVTDAVRLSPTGGTYTLVFRAFAFCFNAVCATSIFALSEWEDTSSEERIKAAMSRRDLTAESMAEGWRVTMWGAPIGWIRLGESTLSIRTSQDSDAQGDDGGKVTAQSVYDSNSFTDKCDRSALVAASVHWSYLCYMRMVNMLLVDISYIKIGAYLSRVGWEKVLRKCTCEGFT